MPDCDDLFTFSSDSADMVQPTLDTLQPSLEAMTPVLDELIEQLEASMKGSGKLFILENTESFIMLLAFVST